MRFSKFELIAISSALDYYIEDMSMVYDIPNAWTIEKEINNRIKEQLKRLP